MFTKFLTKHSYLFLLSLLTVLLSGCISVKTDKKTPTLLKTETANQSELMAEVNRFASVTSVRAKMDLKFEDNSFAQFGNKEVYRAADGEVTVMRPANIFMKVQVPVIKSDVAQMSSDGTKFQVAILQDGGSGKYKKFVIGTNDADYSKLQKKLSTDENADGQIKQNVNAFANLRPQHFTDAMLVRPTNSADVYTQSSIYQIEEDEKAPKKSPLRSVLRGYYLLDEFVKRDDGSLKIERRFWFDRVGGIRLARQQIFDSQGEIESDIVYGRQGALSDQPEYRDLPLEIVVTRPQEKYSMKLTYQTPSAAIIGRSYPETGFVLKNSWGLEVLDLDKQLNELNNSSASQPVTPPNEKAATRVQ